MAKIVYFIAPTSVIKVGTKLTEFVPILGPAAQYTRKARQITELADPVSAT